MKTMQQVQRENLHQMEEVNQEFYQRLWTNSKFYGPEHFNTWEILSEFCRTASRRLEIGPGLRPRLSLEGTEFIDLSEIACQHLRQAGGLAHAESFETFQFAEKKFDLIGLFDVIEHIPSDQAVFSQLSQLLVNGGILFFSVPLHSHAWTTFDALVGHFGGTTLRTSNSCSTYMVLTLNAVPLSACNPRVNSQAN